MKATVLVVYDEDDIEVLINDVSVRCFVAYSPGEITVGGVYDVNLDLNLADDCEVYESSLNEVAIQKKDGWFSYYVTGFLGASGFHSFVDFDVEPIQFEYPDLIDHYVTIDVLRIDISFE